MKDINSLTITNVVIGIFLLLGINVYAVSPCNELTTLSGGIVLSDTIVNGDTETGYYYSIWHEADNGGELTLYPKDACFKASWNEKGEFYAGVGKSFNDSFPQWDQLGGDLIVNFAFEKSGDDGGSFSYIGIEGFMKDPVIQWNIIEDWMSDIDTFKLDESFVRKGQIIVEGDVYDIWTKTGFQNSVMSVRQTRRQCGTINISEHFRQWEKMDVNLNFLSQALICVDANDGVGSVDFSYATMEIIPRDESEEDSLSIENEKFPWGDTTTIKQGAIVVTETSTKEIDNGYGYELYQDNPTGGMIVYGGEDDCAFKAGWEKSGDFLAQVGYYDKQASKTYSELGEITADYEYTRSGSSVSYSYIGIHGYTLFPSTEYYIVEDFFEPRFNVFSAFTEIGSYDLDDATYTLYRHIYQVLDITGVSTKHEIYAVRSTPRTSAHVSISEHFKKWEEFGDTLGKLSSCMISCEVYGGNGTIEYTKATMSWSGQDRENGALSVIDGTESLKEGNSEFVISPNPAENFFVVKSVLDIYSIEIFNEIGQSVCRQNNGDAVGFFLPAGLYWVKIISTEGVQSVRKLIVK